MARIRPLLFFTSLLLTIAVLSACERAPGPSWSLEVARIGTHGSALSTTGNMAAIGSIYDGASLWQIDSSERLYNWNHTDKEPTTVVAADFSPDDRWALTADPHTLVLWSTETGEAARFWTAPGDILDIALSPGGRYALLALADFSAVLFDVQKGGIKRTFTHTNRVRSVDVSADGKLAVTGSEDFTAVVWDVASGKALHTIKHGDDVQLVAISPDGKLVLSVGKYDQALLWQADSGNTVGRILLRQEHLRRGMRFTSARFSEDGKFLLTGRPDQIVQLWDTTSLKQLKRWKLPKRDPWKPTSAAVVAVSFSERPNHFFAVASNGFVHRLER